MNIKPSRRLNGQWRIVSVCCFVEIKRSFEPIERRDVSFVSQTKIIRFSFREKHLLRLLSTISIEAFRFRIGSPRNSFTGARAYVSELIYLHSFCRIFEKRYVFFLR